MEDHLGRHDYFVGNRYSIADIALYAYTHVAHEGELRSGRYPAINAWLNRVASQTGPYPHHGLSGRVDDLVIDQDFPAICEQYAFDTGLFARSMARRT